NSPAATPRNPGESGSIKAPSPCALAASAPPANPKANPSSPKPKLARKWRNSSRTNSRKVTSKKQFSFNDTALSRSSSCGQEWFQFLLQFREAFKGHLLRPIAQGFSRIWMNLDEQGIRSHRNRS